MANQYQAGSDSFFWRHIIGIYEISMVTMRYSTLGITFHGLWRGSIKEAAIGGIMFGVGEIIHQFGEHLIRDGQKQKYQRLYEEISERLPSSEGEGGIEQRVTPHHQDDFRPLPPDDGRQQNLPQW